MSRIFAVLMQVLVFWLPVTLGVLMIAFGAWSMAVAPAAMGVVLVLVSGIFFLTTQATRRTRGTGK